MTLSKLAALCVIAFLPAGAAERRHVEDISSARHEYSVRLGGKVDGASTRDPIVYAAWKQGFDPMRSVRLENTGDTDVVNPWLLVNGKRNWRTTADIAGEAMRTYGDPARMTDGEKARAIWEFLRRNRFHATTGDFEVRDPVKMFNVYGFSLCGDNAPVLMDLWRAAGLRARRGFPIGHCVAEVWYDGGWHLLDGDESILFLERDNRTVAAEHAVARDHDLSRRAYENEYLPALYNYDGSRSGDYPAHTEHRMEFTLRPGEALEWRWGQGEKLHYAPNPVLFLLKSADLHDWGPNAWATLRNGKWIYTPRLGRKGAPLTWKIRTPYVIVGGRVRARGGGSVRAFGVVRRAERGGKSRAGRAGWRRAWTRFSRVRARRTTSTSCARSRAGNSSRSRSRTICRWRRSPCRRWSWGRTASPTRMRPPDRGRCARRSSGWRTPRFSRPPRPPGRCSPRMARRWRARQSLSNGSPRGPLTTSSWATSRPCGGRSHPPSMQVVAAKQRFRDALGGAAESRSEVLLARAREIGRGRVGAVEQDVELRAAGARSAARCAHGGACAGRVDAGVEGEPERPQARAVPRVRERREGLHRGR